MADYEKTFENELKKIEKVLNSLIKKYKLPPDYFDNLKDTLKHLFDLYRTNINKILNICLAFERGEITDISQINLKEILNESEKIELAADSMLTITNQKFLIIELEFEKKWRNAYRLLNWHLYRLWQISKHFKHEVVSATKENKLKECIEKLIEAHNYLINMLDTLESEKIKI